jgi:hypothetical protein
MCGLYANCYSRFVKLRVVMAGKSRRTQGPFVVGSDALVQATLNVTAARAFQTPSPNMNTCACRITIKSHMSTRCHVLQMVLITAQIKRQTVGYDSFDPLQLLYSGLTGFRRSFFLSLYLSHNHGAT